MMLFSHWLLLVVWLLFWLKNWRFSTNSSIGNYCILKRLLHRLNFRLRTCINLLGISVSNIKLYLQITIYIKIIVIHNEFTRECNRRLKKITIDNIVDITQTVNINSWEKITNRFAQTFDGIMKSNCRSYKKFK